MRKGRSRGYLPGILVLLSTVLAGSQGLEVSAIEGPSVVVNGSTQLVLDCKYDLTDYDKTSLVIKWYFQRKPYPVYQWIPNNDPQDLGILKGRLNLNYEVSADEYSKHRALAILNPTTELTGEYTCWISSFENEDFKTKMVTVYAPPSDMTLTYSKPLEDSVVVTCRAGGVFPAPNIAIFRSSSSVRRDVIENAKVERQHFPELGYYNISIELEAFDYELDTENMFECVLTIPGTEFEMHEEILYFPGVPALKSSVWCNSCAKPRLHALPLLPLDSCGGRKRRSPLPPSFSSHRRPHLLPRVQPPGPGGGRRRRRRLGAGQGVLLYQRE